MKTVIVWILLSACLYAAALWSMSDECVTPEGYVVECKDVTP